MGARFLRLACQGRSDSALPSVIKPLTVCTIYTWRTCSCFDVVCSTCTSLRLCLSMGGFCYLQH